MSIATDIPLRSAKSILLVGAERIGDMLFATPAIKMLRDFRPDARIDALVFSELSREILLKNPAINHIHVGLNRWQIKRLAKNYEIAVAVHESKQILKCARYFPNLKMYKRDSMRMHMSMFPIKFIRELLEEPDLPYPASYQLFPQSNHFQVARKLLEEKGADLDSDTLICCHMGCRRVARRGNRLFKGNNVAGETKCWDFRNYTKLVGHFNHEHPETKFVLTGTKGEKRIATEYLSNMSNIINLIGQTSVLDLAALMKYCRIFLSANTGPLHIACATDIPLVTLIGKHDPEIYGPSPPAPHRITIHNAASIDNISVDEVRQALLNI